MKNIALMMGAASLCAACGNTQQILTNTLSNVSVADMQKGFTAVKSTVEAQRDLTDDEEAAVGAGIASGLLGASPVWSDKKAQRYVNTVGHWVAQQSERPDIAWHFAVLDDSTYNSWSVPGGYVFITRGLLLNLHNEAELAGVLGHEIAHVVRKHHLKAIQSNSWKTLFSGAVSYTTQKNANMFSNDPRMNQIATNAVSAAPDLYVRGLDKSDEFEADRMAVVLAARAGYDPYGLPAALQGLQSVNPNAGGLALLFKTHPSFQSRLDQLALVMGPNFDQYEKQPDLAGRFKQQVAQPKAAK